MSVPFVAATGTLNASLTAATPAPPAGIANNDILLLIVQVQGGQVVAAPSGWNSTSVNTAGSTITLTGTSSNAGSGVGIYVFWKRTTGTEATPTVADSGDHQAATIIAIRNCISTADPIDAYAATAVSAAATSYVAPTVTTLYPDNMILVIYGNAVDSNTVSSPNGAASNSAGLSLAFQYADNTNVGTGGGFSVYAGPAYAIAAAGTTTATGTSSVQVNVTIAFRPERSRATVTG